MFYSIFNIVIILFMTYKIVERKFKLKFIDEKMGSVKP